MEYAIPFATLFWLFVPMPLVILLSIVTLFNKKKEV